jgi:hypothetical protein
VIAVGAEVGVMFIVENKLCSAKWAAIILLQEIRFQQVDLGLEQRFGRAAPATF